jgi:hypothetical protein
LRSAVSKLISPWGDIRLCYERVKCIIKWAVQLPYIADIASVSMPCIAADFVNNQLSLFQCNVGDPLPCAAAGIVSYQLRFFQQRLSTIHCHLLYQNLSVISCHELQQSWSNIAKLSAISCYVLQQKLPAISCHDVPQK